MSSAEKARQLLSELGKSSESARETIRKWFTDETRWENVGLRVTNGVDEAIAFHDQYDDEDGLETIEANILNIVEDGNKVLMERTDTMRRRNGSLIASFPVMSFMEFDGDKIVQWRDYFDTVPWMSPRA